VTSAKIIERIEASEECKFITHAKVMALTHHEWWNGNGYPLRLTGHNIPLQGRIMAVADVYDALITARPYKEAFSHAQAVEIIQNESGTTSTPPSSKSSPKSPIPSSKKVSCK
jgi:putative two-component system response regulator